MTGLMYPNNLPHPHFTTGIKQQKNFLRSELASGRVRQRRLFLSTPCEQTLEWRLKPADAAAFLGWVDYALNGGVGWFRLNQRTELGVMPVDVRMTQHPLENAKSHGGKFFYKVKCELRKYPIQDPAKTVEAELAPHTWLEFIDNADISRYYTESWINGKQ